MLVDLRNLGLTGKVAQLSLDRSRRFTVNKNTVPSKRTHRVRHDAAFASHVGGHDAAE